MRGNKIGNPGFTLVELVIVIAIIGILAAISIASFTNFIIKGKEMADTTVAKKIQRAIIVYRNESNDEKLNYLPHSSSSELVTSLQNTTIIPSTASNAKPGSYGPYLESGITIKPQQNNMAGWIIHVDSDNNVVSVSPGTGNPPPLIN